jgi:hypothetical protein
MEATHQQLQQRKQSFTFQDFKHYLGIVRRILSWALLALAVAVLVGIFLPVQVSAPPTPAEQELIELGERFAALMGDCKSRGVPRRADYAFTNAEATLLANRLLQLDGAGGEDVGYGLAPEHVSIRFLSTKYVKLILRSRAFKKVRVYSTLVGRFTEANGNYRFDPTSAKVGRVSLPGPAARLVVGRFETLFSDVAELDTLANGAELVEVYQGEVVVHPKSGRN